MHTLRALAALALLSTFAPATAQTAVRAWEHESSDLSVDSRIHFGHLDNGLRYAWVDNGEPQHRCYVRLHVNTGSMSEKDTEQGIAHFLEHMAFNGSEHFAAGTLVEWFQRHGMSFGADTNAHTGFSETVYELDLPTSEEELLRDGFQIMRDYADGLLLEAEEVQAEKGVIDAEERERDSAGYRVFMRLLDEQYAETRYPERMPIGRKQVRDAFTAESVRAFYERWYRPDNMTLVVVGDLGEFDPTGLIVEYFAGMERPERALGEEPSRGAGALEERFFAIHEPEIPQVSINVERLLPWEEEPDTAAERVEDLPLAFARSMLNLRYSELSRKAGTAFLGAGVAGAGGLQVYRGESMSVSCEPEKWREALAAAEAELRRALEYGFQEAELDELRADALRGLDEAVEREATRHSAGILAELLAATENRVVPTNAETERAIARPAIEGLTVEACHAAFVEGWSEGVLNVYISGAHTLGDDAVEVLAGAYRELSEREVERGELIAVQTFAYASEADAAGTVTDEEHVDDLDLHMFSFENGVRLNVKRTDFRERQILVTSRLAEGLLTLDKDDFAVGWAANTAFNLGGLGEHTEDELRRLTAGKQVGVTFGMSEDAFTLGGATTSEDLLMQFELMCAYINDPGWRDDGLREIKERLPLIFDQLAHQPDGPLLLEFLPALFSGDMRFAQLPRMEDVEPVQMDAIREWLTPSLTDGPLEVTVVGDLDVEQVREAAARTFGALAPRRAVERHAERRQVGSPKTGLRMERSVETQIPKSLVFIGFPTTDGLESTRRRNLGFLGDIVSDRLRIEVRERLGDSYSPRAGSSANQTFEGVGMLQMQANADPDKVERLVEACLEVARDLEQNGVTQEEVTRLAEPVIAKLRDAKRSNGWWLSVLRDAQTNPATLDDMRSVEEFYNHLSAEELSKLTAAYLDPERASVLVVNPQSAAP